MTDFTASRGTAQRGQVKRITASLLTLAKDNGLTRVDHVLLSDKTKDLPAAQTLFVVQGDPKDPAMLRAHMPTAEAAQRPVQDSFAQLESINQQLAQDRTQEQAVEQRRSQEQHQRGPVPSL
ncbi:XVIPCD domain-containing protein [Xanthomonas campestris]|uniref:XVIPCD domain-containing protein n=1 Tax=Xanthomonas campestris TaxID=339 RepID=UPI003083E907